MNIDKLTNKIEVECCKFYDVNVESLSLPTRNGKVVKARQLSHFFLKEMSKLKLEEIGSRIGGKDHATVLYSIKQVNNKLFQYKNFSAQLDGVRKKILKQPIGFEMSKEFYMCKTLIEYMLRNEGVKNKDFYRKKLVRKFYNP